MGSEPFVVFNPKGNNRDLIVETVGQSGKTIRLAFLKPGQSFRSEKDTVSIRAVKRPITLDMVYADGVFSYKADCQEA